MPVDLVKNLKERLQAMSAEEFRVSLDRIQQTPRVGPTIEQFLSCFDSEEPPDSTSNLKVNSDYLESADSVASVNLVKEPESLETTILQFQNFFIRKSFFSVLKSEEELYAAADIDSANQSESDVTVEIHVIPKGNVLKERGLFCLVLDAEISVRNNSNKQTLKISLSTVTTFTYSTSANLEEYKQGVFITAPLLAFPYLKAYVNYLSILAGAAPVVLPPMNFQEVGNKLKDSITEA